MELFLTKRKIQFVNNMKKLSGNDDGDDDNSASVVVVEKKDLKMLKKIVIIIENLTQIVEQLVQSRIARLMFMQNFEDWIRTRKSTIEKLKKISCDISSRRRNCNWTRLFAHVASFFGGALQMLSLLATPATLGLSTPLAAAGYTIALAGSAEAGYTACKERSELKKNLKEVTEIIRGDEFFFNHVGEWMEHEAKLKKDVSEILKMQIIADITPVMKKFVENSLKIDDDSKQLIYMEEKINDVMMTFYQHVPNSVSPMVAHSLMSLMSAVFITMEYSDNGYTFECISMTVKGIFGMLAVADELIGTSGMVGRKILAPIGMAIDAGGIFLTSVDLLKGSHSPEAEKVLELANKMEAEMKVLKQAREKLDEETVKQSE